MLPVAIEDARFSQPRKNLARQASRTQHRHTRLTFQVSTDQAAIRLAAQILQVLVTHLPRVNERIGHQFAQEVSPRCVRKLRRCAKLSKLTHHRILAHERRMQTADHFEQKPVRFTSAIGL